MIKRIVALGLIVWIGSCFSVFGQDMKKGFTHLELGEFALAETFFEGILKTYPDNKTAKLCYARATGLSGKPKKALGLLDDLNIEYPNDFEIGLNYAEALLWNKDFVSAEGYYINLLKVDSTSFPAVLGFANTLSSLKKYDKALTYVNKGLEISPGNQGAMISKKYIQLGYANQYLKLKEYDFSITLLKDNLTLFPGDVETLLNLANTYIIAGSFEEAKSVYLQLNGSDKEKVQSKLGLSLVAHLMESEKQALEESQLALQMVEEVSDSNLTKNAKERYVQALIWNKQFGPAQTYIDSLDQSYTEQNWILGLKAMLSVYKRDFNKSIFYYKKMLANDSTSFDGNLGLANAYKAVDKYDEAYAMGMQTLKIFEGQKDAQQFLEDLEYMFYPNLSSVLKYSFDNGDNESYALTNRVLYPLTSKFALRGSHTFRKTFNDVTDYRATVNHADVGVDYRFIHTVLMKVNMGVNVIGIEDNNYNQWLAKIAFETKPVKLQQLTFGYSRELEDFNAQLIDRRITKDIIFFNHNLNTNFNLGWFNQYFYTSQNDGNVRHLYFTSLYYNLMNKPAVKVGVNFQYITFSKQVPTIYFSPARFKVIECFGEVLKGEGTVKEKGAFYGLSGALGYQFIEDEEKQLTYRLKAELGYKTSKRFFGSVYAQKSNIASGNSGGFSYTEIGIQAKLIFQKRSVFRKNKSEDE